MTETNKAYQLLLEMYGIIERNTAQLPRECFNQLVRFLADCVRVHPLPPEDRAVAAQLVPLAMPFIEAYYEDPQDHLAQLFTEKGCKNDALGQIMTPRYLVQYMVKTTIGTAVEEADSDDDWIRILDPAVGTGIFLVESARMFLQRPFAFYGVELDIDLYRATLVNMRLAALGRPYFILRANTIVVDVGAGSPNWRFANQWKPPDWQTAMTMEDGNAWQEWCEKEGTSTEDALVPRQKVKRSGDQDDDPLQPRLF